ncbi:thioesterase II family protein [Paenibacillus wynnii]|uniref:thioesterase II family protein n=1 Tax=Paenibacillus wynnii TaxID=268407 RepID=UPI00278DA936|nr:thioesterase domain-containing protein [Paenibacillus wynnii]MDQ0195343.1 surfactin synthase thioesterase subunit [Paenibacillus wynnii]
MSYDHKSPIKLICFPFAGAGASFYSGWNEFFDSSIEVLPIQLPGRERLIAEEPYRNIHVAADDFAKMIEEEGGNSLIALFGHCFLGATLAFEVARRLESRGNVKLIRLFVSAASSPKNTRDYSLSSYSDDQFLEAVEKLTGFVHHAFAIPELRELLLPTLRADFEMDETYINESGCSINTPITGMFAADDSFVVKDDVALWKECTSGDFELFQVTGEHMYITSTAEQAKEIIKNTLANIHKDGAFQYV